MTVVAQTSYLVSASYFDMKLMKLFKCVVMLVDLVLRKITRVAWYCIRCKFVIKSRVEKYSRDLQLSILDIAKTDTNVEVAVFVTIL